MDAPPLSSRSIVIAGLVWLIVALAAGASGALEGRLRVDLRWLVALHVTRFVGAEFLAFYRRGELPFAFAVPGAWGDMAVAAAAILVLASGPPRTRARRFIYGAWNVLGLADLLFVVTTAARLALTNPDSMRALLRLPLSLLPTFLVPVLVASHGLIAVRLAGRPSAAVDTPQAAP